MNKEERSHDLGDKFRDKAAGLREKFINWTAVSAGAGIALAIQLAGQAPHKAEALHALLPSLIAWLISILAAAATLFGAFEETLFAGFSHHEQGRRERQHRKIDELTVPTSDDILLDKKRLEEREKRIGYAKLFQARANRYHQLSRFWLYFGSIIQFVGGFSFLAGLMFAMYLLADGSKMTAIFAPLAKP